MNRQLSRIYLVAPSAIESVVIIINEVLARD